MKSEIDKLTCIQNRTIDSLVGICRTLLVLDMDSFATFNIKHTKVKFYQNVYVAVSLNNMPKKNVHIIYHVLITLELLHCYYFLYKIIPQDMICLKDLILLLCLYNVNYKK